MSVSMHDISVPVIERIITNLGEILDKAVEHLTQRKITENVFLDARLYPDMFPLTSQVQTVSDVAKGAIGRLGNVEIPKYPDTEKSFAELKVRLGTTLAFIRSVDVAAIDASAERPIELTGGGRTHQFTGLSYLTGFVLPNLYFHTSITYAILRHNGVELGKRDYLGKS